MKLKNLLVLRMKTLNRQLNIAFGVVLFAPMIVAAAFSIWYFTGKIEREAVSKIEADARAARTIFDGITAEMEARAKDYSRKKTLILLINYIGDGSALGEKISKDFAETARGEGLEIIAVDRSQKIIVHSEKLGEGETFLPERHIDSAILGVCSHGIEVEPDGIWATGIAPVYSRDESIAGAVVARRKLDKRITDTIRNSLKIEVSLFSGKKLIAGAAVEPPPEIFADVYNYRETFVRANITEGGGISSYQPITDFNGKPAGILIIRTDATPYVETRNNAILVLLGILCVGVMLAYLTKEFMRLELESHRKTLEIKTAQIENLNRELFKAQESERRRIALDLHDGIIQSMAALLMRYREIDYNRKALMACNNDFKTCISELRGIIHGLHPAALETFGIHESLKELCFEFQRETGIVVNLTSSGKIEMGYDASINLYRVVQEALNNIRNHSGANIVTVKIVGSHDETLIRISDNGAGFDADEYYSSRNGRHMGIRGMSERIKYLDGDFNISSQTGKGVKISILVPNGN